MKSGKIFDGIGKRWNETPGRGDDKLLPEEKVFALLLFLNPAHLRYKLKTYLKTTIDNN